MAGLLAAHAFYTEAMWTVAKQIWAEPAVPDRPRVSWRDQVFAVVVLAIAVIEVVLRSDVGWDLAALGVGAACAAAVLIRRTRPLTAVGISFGALLAMDLAATSLSARPVVLYTAAIVVVVVYCLFRWGSGQHIVLGAVLITAEYVVALATDSTGTQDGVGGAGVLLFAAAVGVAVRYRWAARTQLVERVRIQEREQFARELHDTVAHHVSAIAIQAQAGLVLEQTSGANGTAEVLQTINSEAAKALDEMRAMVGNLRGQGGTSNLAHSHGLTDIANLANQGALPEGGKNLLRVEVTMDGNLKGLGSTLEAALFRVAQESVTNARTHARAATKVVVTVMGESANVVLTIQDNGRNTPSTGIPGFGLIGMAERVRLLGGELSAGPYLDHGWLVQAILPRERSTRS